MCLQKLKKNNSGFTLLEVLVSASIMIIMSGVFLVNYQRYKSQGELDMAVQLVITNIRKVQGYALASKVDEIGPDVTSPPTVPNIGWGIQFLEGDNKMTIFSDTGCCDRLAVGSEENEVINLPDGITISEVLLESAWSTALHSCTTNLHINFRPSKPEVVLARYNSPCGGAVKLRDSSHGQIILSNGTDTRVIEVNNVGRITVN